MTAFNNGISVVTGLNHNSDSNDSIEKGVYEKGVIDTFGKWRVQYGKYKDIGEFNNGYARVKLIVENQKGYYDYEGIIDDMGKYKFTIPSKKWKLDYGNDNFHQDIAIIEIYSVDPDTVKLWSPKNRYDYKGAINTKGEIIFSNTDWDELTPFSFNRAFAIIRSTKPPLTRKINYDK